MSITYRTDSALRVVFVQWHGDVNAEEFAGYLKNILADEEALACGRSITDLRGVSRLALDYLDLRKNVEFIRSLLGERRWKSALIATEATAFGKGRQFSAIADGLIEGCIFSNEAEALEWILR